MKGQVMIDGLMLVLILVVMVSTMHLFLGEQAVKSQTIRYQATQHQTTMLSVLEKQVELENMRGRVIDVLGFHACNGCPANQSIDYCPGLSEEINSTLYKINQGQKHYIFASSGLTVYDDRDTVCLDAVPVARHKIDTVCGELEVIYGSWFNWFDPPEVC